MQRLLTTSFDDTLRVWGDTHAGSGGVEHAGQAMEQLVSIHHNNDTGRWITPFRWGRGGVNVENIIV